MQKSETQRQGEARRFGNARRKFFQFQDFFPSDFRVGWLWAAFVALGSSFTLSRVQSGKWVGVG